MNRPHLTQDQLIDALYGVAESSQHLEDCLECQARLQAFEQPQAQSGDAQLPAHFYHQQRRRILDRLSAPSSPRLSPVWVPAAVAALMAVGLVLSRHSGAPQSRPQAPSSAVEIREAVLDETETGWFEDTYTEMQGSEPRALSPMRSLFAEGSRNQ